MQHSILISYPEETVLPLKIDYSIVLTDEMHTITCTVDGNRFPIWLQLRKFNMLSLKKKGFYIPLYNEANNSKNMDTTLFIDLVYSRIMDVEKLKIFDIAIKN
jgi:hypothetical protein